MVGASSIVTGTSINSVAEGVSHIGSNIGHFGFKSSLKKIEPAVTIHCGICPILLPIWETPSATEFMLVQEFVFLIIRKRL